MKSYFRKTVLTVGVVFMASVGMGADWPTYQADPARTGISEEQLVFPLITAWAHRSVHPPQPAWQGEAKWDGWNKVYDLKARQTFDRAFHPVSAEGRVLFGSSSDDKIYCLDLDSGQELWVFYTEGPVRFAPTLSDGRVYVGSDDGYVYCLSLQSGKELWRTRPGPREYRIPGNGRVISAWPVRTAVIVMDGLAYCGAGMFPSEGVYINALNAMTGEILWRKMQTDLPAQGYMLASRTRLYVPAGRNNPVVLDRRDGSRLRVVSGSGGTYALLTGDTLVFGPGKTGQLGVVEADDRDQLASFSGNHMIVRDGVSYLHSDNELSALDRSRYLELVRERKAVGDRQRALNKRLNEPAVKGDSDLTARLQGELTDLGSKIDALTRSMANCVSWTRGCDLPYAIILAGDTLIAGGENRVGAFRADTGQPVWDATVEGDAYGLAVSNGHLLVGTDRGTIHAFSGGATVLNAK